MNTWPSLAQAANVSMHSERRLHSVVHQVISANFRASIAFDCEFYEVFPFQFLGSSTLMLCRVG